jgi:predicted amidohydrolase
MRAAMATIRLSAASFKAGPVSSFDDFAHHAAVLVDEAAVDKPDFLLFPELLTAEIINSFGHGELPMHFARLTRHTGAYVDLFRQLARDKGFYIAAGSHLKEEDSRYYNTAHLFTPDGEVWEQKKCHLFPAEAAWTTPGDELAVFETEKGKVSILTCYDLEFPEMARLATLQGADLVLSPSATRDEHGYWRVRHCAQARCIENQVFVAHCSLLGTVAGLPFYGMSSVLTPCDGAFPSNGVAAEGRPDEESIVTSEVDTELLHEIRQRGAATTLKDRRWDMLSALYELECGRAAIGRAYASK